MPETPSAAVAAAREALLVAARAVESAAERSSDAMAEAIALVASCAGRVVVSGLGKSGLVGAKIAATLSSTGTPAAFVHAADALHGDSGAVRPGDVVMAISNSGETDELCAFVSMVAARSVPVIAISGCDGSSRLAAAADVVLDASVEREGDPHGIVPSASTSVVIALGDALAIGLMVERGFGPEDFRQFHPGGTLGRKLST